MSGRSTRADPAKPDAIPARTDVVSTEAVAAPPVEIQMPAVRQIAALLLAFSLLFAACASTGGSPTASIAASPAIPSATGPVTVGTASSPTLGTFLTGPGGMTLYTHAGDGTNLSTCTGGCLTAWPPLSVSAGQQPTAGPGVTGHLATFARSDGPTQVTYNGWPLYSWPGDTKPGDATGQGIGGFSVATAAVSPPAQYSPAAPSGSGTYSY
jgi:predicted lipoprotein with Yx(FWY)xxD motif